MHITKINTILPGQNLKIKGIKIARNGVDNFKNAFNSELMAVRIRRVIFDTSVYMRLSGMSRQKVNKSWQKASSLKLRSVFAIYPQRFSMGFKTGEHGG